MNDHVDPGEYAPVHEGASLEAVRAGFPVFIIETSKPRPVRVSLEAESDIWKLTRVD